MSINKRIRDARLARNMSANALAKAVGVTSTAAWNWDHENTTPRRDTLEKIASALEVDFNYLLTGENAPSSGAIKASPTVAEVLSEAKQRIAIALGVGVDQVSLDLKVMS